MSSSQSMVIKIAKNMVVSPEFWQPNQAGGYKFVDIINKLGESNQAHRWDVGDIGVQPVAEFAPLFPKCYINTDYVSLTNSSFLFRFARLLKTTVRIEWLGRLEEYQSAINAATTDGQGTYNSWRLSELRVQGFGTTLLGKFCHERYDRNRADNLVEMAMAPAYMFGWNRLPILVQPDRISTIDARGTSPSGHITTAPGVKLMRFTPERRVKYLTYKPLNRLDKAGATFDLAKLNAIGANWDDDMRSGSLWLAQQSPIDQILTLNDETRPLPNIQTCPRDFFRISYVNTWKYYGASPQGQDNPAV